MRVLAFHDDVEDVFGYSDTGLVVRKVLLDDVWVEEECVRF